MPKLEAGRLRPIGAELVFFSNDLKKKFFSIPLSLIQSIVVDQQKLSPSQKRGVYLGWASPSLTFFAKDSIYVTYLDGNNSEHRVHFAIKFDQGLSLKLEIENRMSKIKDSAMTPMAIAQGNLIYVLLQALEASRLRPLHSFYFFNMPWGTKIIFILIGSLILAVFFVQMIPK